MGTIYLRRIYSLLSARNAIRGTHPKVPWWKVIWFPKNVPQA